MSLDRPYRPARGSRGRRPQLHGAPPNALAARSSEAVCGATNARLSRRTLIAALVGGAAGVHAADAPGEQRHAWPSGRPTPTLDLPAWQGPNWSLAGARGEVVLLNFWASWCEPCRAEMPALELLAERHVRDRVQVLAVNFRETDGAIRRFLAQTDCSLPILRDADGGATHAFGVRMFPSTVVIGRNGRAAFTVIGEFDWTGAEARAWLAPLI
jgi:thiol-disulfide isomerase/thioredoxin